MNEYFSSGDETSPTVSLKSKLGVNFLVSCARSQNSEAENALAKLLQASKDMMAEAQAASSSTSPTAALPTQPVPSSVASPPTPILPPGLNPLALAPPGLAQTLGEEAQRRASLAAHPVFGPEPEEESCGRPFCKLKRRAHYHCNLCNQGFTEKDKLESHLKRHLSGQPEPPSPSAVNLASLLRGDGVPREAIPLSADLLRTPQPEVKEGNSAGPLTPPATGGMNNNETKNGGGSSGANSRSGSPAVSTASPSPAVSNASSAAAAAAAAAAASFTSPPFSLPANFPSPFASLVRGGQFSASSLISAAGAAAAAAAAAGANTPAPGAAGSPLLLPPGLPPFLAPGMLLPGLPGATPQGFRPGLPAGLAPHPLPAPTFDPTRHPLTRPPAEIAARRASPFLSSTGDASSDDPSDRRLRLLKDEPVPEGYMRFRFNEDCGFVSCNYREHQTHFHCMRRDCNYRFCDKTRFVQHTARHERLDTLCGQEFEGFRGVPCGRDNCELNVANAKGEKSWSHIIIRMYSMRGFSRVFLFFYMKEGDSVLCTMVSAQRPLWGVDHHIDINGRAWKPRGKPLSYRKTIHFSLLMKRRRGEESS
jgi:hypothetical protein